MLAEEQAVPLQPRLVVVADRLPALVGIALDVGQHVEPVARGLDLLELVHRPASPCGARGRPRWPLARATRPTPARSARRRAPRSAGVPGAASAPPASRGPPRTPPRPRRSPVCAARGCPR